MPQYFENDPSLEDDYKTCEYAYAGVRFYAVTNSGIFSPGHVDEGTDILIKSLPETRLHGDALDLGCGCGIIGTVLAKRFGMNVTLSDINERATDCAVRTLQANGVEAKVVVSDGFEKLDGEFDVITLNPPVHCMTAKVVVSDGFEKLDGEFDVITLNPPVHCMTAKVVVSDGFEKLDGEFDVITLNPPVHAGKDVMFSLYAGAFAHLRTHGAFYVVIRKKHGAASTEAELIRLFGECGTVYKKGGVFVYECVKHA